MPLGDNTADTYENYEKLALSGQRDGPTRQSAEHKLEPLRITHYVSHITHHGPRLALNVFNHALEG